MIFGRRHRKNKKAQMVKTFIQIIFFVMLFFVAFKTFNYLMGFWIKDLEQGTIKSLEGLKIEIDNMVRENASVPVYIDHRHQINGFVQLNKIGGCQKEGSCLCICSRDSDCENNALKRCLPIDTKLANDFTCNFKEDAKGNTRTYNAFLSKEENKVRVTCN